MVVRGAAAEDVRRLLEIYAYYVENTAISFEYDVPSPDEFRDRIRNTLEKYPYLVVEEDGLIEGYAYAGPFKGRAAYQYSCEVSIYLDRNARGKGYARALYEALEDSLKKRGITNLYACIADPVTEDEYLTKNSERFHHHMGYTKVGELHKCAYKFGRWYSMIWMEKVISGHAAAQEEESPNTSGKKDENMVLETDRLILRPFRREDLDLIQRIYCDERVLKYTPFDAMSSSQAESRLEHIIQNFGTAPEFNYEMAVLRKGTGEKIGRAHIEVDPETDTGMIGWFLIPEHWGQGYATEMTRVLIDCCFDTLHLHRVNALCNPENEASWHVLEKCGMRREAYFRKKCRYEKGGTTRWEDELQYAVLSEEMT